MNRSLVLLTGATGYVGGRLLKKLEALGNFKLQPRPSRHLHFRGEAERPIWFQGLDAPAIHGVAESEGKSTIRETAIFDPVVFWAGRTGMRFILFTSTYLPECCAASLRTWGSEC